jgi:DNA-binding winged helix-turn-helix (wHTH) protein
MKLNPITLDSEIIDHFAPHIFGSLEYGENRICLWFPCTGKTRTINNLLSSKSELKKILGKSSSRYVFIYYTGTESANLKASEILQNIAAKMGLNSKSETTDTRSFIQKKCKELIEKGKEVVFICDSMESLPKDELEKHLLDISNVVRINEGRIHTILNLHFLEQIMSIIEKQPSLFTLANKIEYISTLPEKLLKKFIEYEAKKHNYKISKKEVEKIITYSGGILTLTKAIIRNGGDSLELDLKFKTIWDHLPITYKAVIEKSVMKSKIINPNEKLVAKLLNKTGILDLSIFKDKFKLTQQNNKIAVKKMLNDNELQIYNYFSKNKNKLVEKEKIAEIVYGKNNEDYSDWSIDQIISRFRKKLAKGGIDPTQLKTIKGRGYKWKG